MQTKNVVTVGEVRADMQKMPADLIYIEKPLVILNEDNVVLWAGDIEKFQKEITIVTGYYDHCIIKAREHDLYLNDNRKIGEAEVETEREFDVQIKATAIKTITVKAYGRDKACEKAHELFDVSEVDRNENYKEEIMSVLDKEKETV